jgi:hypothetical protein
MSDKGVLHSTNEQLEVLQAFSCARRREAHVLKDHPDLLWQQLYNRLQGEPALLLPEINPSVWENALLRCGSRRK